MRVLSRLIAVIAMVVSMAFTAVSFAPSEALADANGQCGGAATSVAQLLSHWKHEGVTQQAIKASAERAGYVPRDGSLRSWMDQRVVRAHTAGVSASANYGCRNGVLFSAGVKTLPAGHPVFAALPMKYSKSEVRTTPPANPANWEEITVTVHIVADASCSNPHHDLIRIHIWIHRHHKPAPKPKPPVKLKKVCVTGTTPFACPTGTFRFQVTAGGSHKTIVMNADPQVIGHYKVGTKVTLKEIKPLGNDQWQTVSANPQHQKVRKGGNLFVFKDREVMPPSCQPGQPGCFLTPSVSASAGACVNQGDTTGTINGVVTNHNDIADTAVITVGSQTTTVSVPAGGSANFSLTGFAPGTYSGTALFQTAGLSSSFQVTVEQCSAPPPSHKVVGSCTGPEEITQNDTVVVPCFPTSNDGEQIGMEVSTDGNSNATGIICKTNGTAMCPSGGKFEFSLKGLNTPSTTVTITFFTADATSVPFVMTFDVDPASDGFN